jgi:hypothetical protein
MQGSGDIAGVNYAGRSPVLLAFAKNVSHRSGPKSPIRRFRPLATTLCGAHEVLAEARDNVAKEDDAGERNAEE